MAETIMIPKRLVKEAYRKGLDVEEIVIRALAKALGMDPIEVAWARLELAQKYLAEAEEVANKDPIQASEKLYKAAEESIKALTEYLGLEEVLAKVRERGRWTITDLERATRIISSRVGEDLYIAWDRACYLHVWGFHEAKLDVDAVKARIPYIEKLVEKTAEIIRRYGGGRRQDNINNMNKQ